MLPQNADASCKYMIRYYTSPPPEPLSLCSIICISGDQGNALCPRWCYMELVRFVCLGLSCHSLSVNGTCMFWTESELLYIFTSSKFGYCGLWLLLFSRWNLAFFPFGERNYGAGLLFRFVRIKNNLTPRFRVHLLTVVISSADECRILQHITISARWRIIK